MANLKEIRNRITSVGSTMQITSAMKMVSAAKLKRAQDAVTQMRPYAGKLKEILGNLSASLDLSENALAEDRGTENVLIIAITSNRGLCGGFNNNIIKQVNQLMIFDYKSSNVKILALGKKAKDAFKRSDAYYESADTNQVPDIFADLSFSNTAILAQAAMDRFMYKSLLDSNASEHGARMTAMHKATDNAKELKRNLTLSYNKARQAAITNEILEIVGGAEALNG